jgi:hypothetical protein
MYSYCYVCFILDVLFHFVVPYTVCVQMCTALLPPGVNPIAVNKYIIFLFQLRVFLEKFSTLYITRRLSTTFTTAPILNHMKAVYTLPPYFVKNHLNIILPYIPRSSKWSLSIPHTCYIHHPSHCPSFDCRDNAVRSTHNKVSHDAT